MSKREPFLLRLDPAVLAALKQWAEAELRSTNAHVEFLLREALRKADRLPKSAAPDPDHKSSGNDEDHASNSDGKC
jgi:hypothetical protein